ncbi:hypothetical protein MR642_06510 [bacterium]|nr:hypothetical protein [bacterium]
MQKYIITLSATNFLDQKDGFIDEFQHFFAECILQKHTPPSELPGNALPHSLPCGREMGEKTAIPREQCLIYIEKKQK